MKMLKKVAVALAVAAVVVLAVTLAAILPTVRSALAQSGTPIATSSPAQAPGATVSKQCYSVPCHGNSAREAIYERIGDGKRDLIRGWGNFDRLHANTYTNDTDQVYGQAGDDFIYVNDGDTLDTAGGASGYDWCYVDARIEAADTCDKVEVR
jgi:hypothetical protein